MTDPSSQEACRQKNMRLIVEEILPFPPLPTEHDVWRRNTLFARLADFAAQETAELEAAREHWRKWYEAMKEHDDLGVKLVKSLQAQLEGDNEEMACGHPFKMQYVNTSKGISVPGPIPSCAMCDLKSAEAKLASREAEIQRLRKELGR